MTRKRQNRMLATLALLLACFFAMPGVACAETPDDALPKGLIAAASTELERSMFASAFAFENIPVDVERVMIGLRYDSGAVDYAEFTDPTGTGFRIGSYDDERHFQEQFRVNSRSVAVFRNDDQSLTLTDWTDSFRSENGAGFAIEAIGSEDGATTRFADEEYHGGFLCVPWGSDGMTVINVVGLEDYVKGVIPYEMSAYWPYEALRAQAVCARTYVVYNLNAYEEFGFDLTNDTESQVYRGVAYADAVTDAAVDSTAGQYVRFRGELCEVYYFASDGGATEDGKNVFGSDRPYLAGKTDPFESALDFTLENWTLYRDGETISEYLGREGYEIAPVVRLDPQYSELGNVIAMRYTDENGQSLSLSARESYSLIRLNNCRFAVYPTEDGFSFRGSGWGHNCGMSQWGANAMASVYGYSCEDIISFYFTGAYVA